MKKVRFGQPEELVPSRFCQGFSYQETEVAFPIDEINFYTNARGCVLEIPCKPNENFYGLGLQLKRFNLTGGKFVLRPNADPIAATGDSHAPVPFFVSTAGYGIYIDTAHHAEFYFGKKKVARKVSAPLAENTIKLSTDDLYKTEQATEDTYTLVQIPATEGVDLYIFEGETITDIVAEYNRLSGGGCSAPEWAFGLFYRCCSDSTEGQVKATADYFRDKKIPCDILGLEPGWQTRAYSCSYLWDPSRYPDPARMLGELKEQGYHINLWEHAFVHPSSPIYSALYEKSGNYSVWNGLVPDFAYEDTKEIFAKHHTESVMFDVIDGFKLDECDGSDYTGGWSFPHCTSFPSGLDGEQYHSLFGTLYMQAILKALDGKETLSEVRNAGALASSYPFVLYSDLYEHKDFIRGMATSGFSGLLWTPEVRHATSKEDFVRRLQAIVFSPQCLINGWYCKELPWLAFDGEDVLREWVLVREALKPMLVKAFAQYREKGIPPIRALVSDYTNDKETYKIDDEYIFCDELVVAPIASGEESRKVYLPEGKWVDYFTGEEQVSGWFEVKTDRIPVYRKIK